MLSPGGAKGTYDTIAADTARIDRIFKDLGDAAACSTRVLGSVTLYVLLGPRLVETISGDCGLAEALARLVVARL